MKFKSSSSINQRIERITTGHLIIGIDIAKERHVAQAINYRGLVQGRSLLFNNSITGFKELEKWTNKLLVEQGKTAVIVGLESTGHYWFNLANWLVNQKLEVVLVNPMTTKRNKENRDNSQSKNDFKDALTIADAVSRGYYADWSQQDETYQNIRVLVDEREYWSDQQVKLKNRIHRCLDIVFPEYKSIFLDWTCPRSIATLKAFPLPLDIMALSVDQVIEGWRIEGFQRAGGNTGIHKAKELITMAKSSIGSTTSLKERKREIYRLIQEYEHTVELISQINEEITQLLKKIPYAIEYMQSIKGLSPLLIAAILANTGDLRKYKDGRQILSQAGLNLVESTSGKKKGQIVLSKRGRRQLRKYLFLAVIVLVKNNETFKLLHQHNVKVLKMKKQRSIFKLIGKFTRILIAMVRNQETFRPDLNTIEKTIAA